MRLVLDTNVIVSAIIAQGVPHELLQTAHKKGFDIYTTIELLDELDVVLRRTKFAPQLALMQWSAGELRQKFEQLSHLVTVPRPYPGAARDAKDDIVLACALAAQAELPKIPILRPKHVLQNIKFRSGVP